MTRFSKLAAVLAVLPVLAVASPVLADSPGQLEGGSLVYEVKNLTQKGGYGNTATANACEQVEYSIDLHNTEFGALSNIVVSVNLPSTSSTSNTSTMTAVTGAGGTTGTTGTATVNLSSTQTISYVNGTTQLFDGKGNLIKTLPDTITSSGVNVGTLNGSTTEFVNFQGKVSCPAPTPTPTTPPKATNLPNTGAGDVLGIFTGASAFGSVGHYVISRRKRGL